MTLEKITEDQEFARRTVELWNMNDEDFFREIGKNATRLIVSTAMNRVYGIRSRFAASHYIYLP